jgi:hypothetical protein
MRTALAPTLHALGYHGFYPLFDPWYPPPLPETCHDVVHTLMMLSLMIILDNQIGYSMSAG